MRHRRRDRDARPATGSYSITITSGALPCVLEAVATAADGGMVSALGGHPDATTANITPLTELLVAQLTGQDPAAYMDSVNVSALAAAVTTATVGTAQTAVLSTLEAARRRHLGPRQHQPGQRHARRRLRGVTGNPMTRCSTLWHTTLTAAGTTLTELTTTVANTSAGEQGGSAAVAETATRCRLTCCCSPRRATATHCAAPTTASSRSASSANATDTSPFTAMETMRMDATTLTATFGDDSTMTMVANGNCRYTLPEGDAAVSPAGVMVIRHMVGADDDTVGANDRGRYHLIVGLPKQAALTVGDLAGTWNFMGMDRDTTATPSGGTMTINASGAITGDRCFENTLDTPDANCTTDAEPVHRRSRLTPMVASPSRLAISSDPWVDRIFTFKAGNGELMLLVINNSGEFVFGTRQRALPLPAVGDASTTLTVLVDPNLVAAPPCHRRRTPLRASTEAPWCATAQRLAMRPRTRRPWSTTTRAPAT